MARIIQVLLPLVCLVLAEAHHLNLPFFDDLPGLPYLPRPITEGHNGGYNTWFQNLGNPDEHSFDSDSHERDKFYGYDPFYHRDPYFQDNGWNKMPGINNVFNIPIPDYNNHRYPPSHTGNNPQEKPKQDHKNIANVQKLEEKPKEIPKIDKKPTKPKLSEDNIPKVKDKLNEANLTDAKNNSYLLPPKTNKIKNENGTVDKDNKQVDLDKKKDFLLVGQGNNGNKVYLLHENKPNPSTVVTPNGNKPGNNIMYVPYNPGQTNNPAYQGINGQPGYLPANVLVTEGKTGVPNGYAGQSNLNTGNQKPGYVTVYSNGQLIQIPGVVVNSAPNNVPIQNGNPTQGTNYMIANTVPNNVQTVPANQNPGTNVIYAMIPNQASNGPIYVQVPNCVNDGSNRCGSGPIRGVNTRNVMSNNGLPSNMVVYQAIPNTVAQPAVLPNGVLNGYFQPNMVASQGQAAITVAIPNPGTVFSNQNSPYQPNQGGMMGNQNVPIRTAVLMPFGNNNNGYNQPTVSSQRQQVNAPTQGVIYYQYTPPQPAVQMPVNNGINGYNQPTVSNQAPGLNAPNQGGIVSNQNIPLHPEVEIPNGYNVNPPVTNPSPAVNVERRGDMPSNQNMQPQPSVTLNSGSLGAQPAIMVSNSKDKSEDIIVEKSKDKKEEIDKGEKKNEKPKDGDKPKDLKPFTNRLEDVKR